MKTRTIRELLEVMLNNIDIMDNGLCTLAYTLLEDGVFTEDEFITIYGYIQRNKPVNLHTIMSLDGYYWEIGEKRPRIKWLKKHIKLNQ